jgi:signal transduction histidine kinase
MEVAFRGDGEALTLRVSDPGRGFAPDLLEGEGPHGLGLVGMRERLLLVGGGLSIESAPGSGTILEAWLPLPVGARGMSRVADTVPSV